MKNYELSKVQFLSNLYAHIKERVSNPEKSVSGRKYLGLPVCSKEDFLIFGLSDPTFHKMFATYRRFHGKRRYVPSIDRINSKKGYVIGNLQFLSIIDNSNKERGKKWFVLQNTKTKKVVRFESTVQAGKFLHHKRELKLHRSAYYDTKSDVKYINKTKVTPNDWARKVINNTYAR
jgi:hypothetical protein